MWHALIWVPVVLLLAVWTALSWALGGALSTVDVQAAAAGAADWAGWLDNWQIPLWLSMWLPMEAITQLKTWLTALGPALQDAASWFPGLLSWLVPLVWVLWALGSVGLLLVAGLGSAVVAAASRTGRQA